MTDREYRAASDPTRSASVGTADRAPTRQVRPTSLRRRPGRDASDTEGGQSEHPSGSEVSGHPARQPALRLLDPGRRSSVTRWLSCAARARCLVRAAAAPRRRRAARHGSQDTIVDGIGFHQTESQPALAAAAGSKTLVSRVRGRPRVQRRRVGDRLGDEHQRRQVWKHGLLPLTVQAGGAGRRTWRGADPSVACERPVRKWLIAATGPRQHGRHRSGSTSAARATASDAGRLRSSRTRRARATRRARPIACDNTPASSGYGTCYIAYDNSARARRNPLQVIRSTDGGATWSAPVGNSRHRDHHAVRRDGRRRDEHQGGERDRPGRRSDDRRRQHAARTRRRSRS